MKIKKFGKGGQNKSIIVNDFQPIFSNSNESNIKKKIDLEIIENKEKKILKEKELERKNKAFLEEYNKQYPERRGIKFPQKNEGTITQDNSDSPYNPLFSPYLVPNLGNQNDQKTFEAQQYLGRDNATTNAFSALSTVPVGKLLNPNNIPFVNEAYKINPFANKLNNPDSYYRIAGKESLDDALSSGVVRSKPPVTSTQGSINLGSRPTSFPSFDKGKVDFSYAAKNSNNVIYESQIPMFKRGDINPVTNQEIKGRHWAYRPIDMQTGETINEIPIDQIKMYTSTPNWLKGYSEILNKQFKNGGKLMGTYADGGQNKPIITNDPKDKRLQAYNDSLDLYNNYNELTEVLKNKGYSNLYRGQNVRRLGDIENKFNETIKHSDTYFTKKERENMYSVADFVNGLVNTSLPRQLFSTEIKPKGAIGYAKDLTNKELSKDTVYINKNGKFERAEPNFLNSVGLGAFGDVRQVADYSNVNPVQPIVYQPKVISGHRTGNGKDSIMIPSSDPSRVDGNTYFDDKGRPQKLMYNPGGINFFREIEQSIQINNIAPNLLPTYQPDNTIETNPFIKGSYFTRPRQSQESQNDQFGRTGKTDMFDKKTGKLIGTYADGGFSERKSKSGRVFKYKSYKI